MLKWVACLIILAGCHKSTERPASGNNSDIIGTWEISVVTGGFNGVEHFAPGNGNTITFDTSGRFLQISYGLPITFGGSYEIKSTSLPDKRLLVMRYDTLALPTITDTLVIKDDMLLLSQPPQCCDIPYEWEYRRIAGEINLFEK